MYKYIISFILFCTYVHAAPWEETIPKVAERAEFFLQEAENRNFTARPTAENWQIDWRSAYREDHECGIVGRMLGAADLVEEYEKIEEPQIRDEMTIDEVARLYATGLTYQAWVEQAIYFNTRTLETKVAYWNDNCANWDTIRYAPKFIITDGPAFGDFPATGSVPDDHTPVMPDFDGRDNWARSFRTRIRDGLAAGPNFAGHYTIIMFGCGTSCRGYFLADTKNGQVFGLPFGGEDTPEIMIDFDIDSQLIHARYAMGFSECALDTWHFDGDDFVRKHEQTLERSESGCNIGNFRMIGE